MAYQIESSKGIGELLLFRLDPLKFVGLLATTGLDVKHLQVGSRNIFFVNHPDLIRDILVTHDWNFVKGRGLRTSRPVLGDGLLTSEGELHRRQRRLVQPAFHSARLASYARTMVECAATASEGWNDGEVRSLDREMMRLTLQIVGRTLFSVDLSNDAASIGKSLHRAVSVFFTLNSPLVQLIPPLRYWATQRAAQSRKEIETVLRKVVDDHRRTPEAYDDMLSMLMRSHDDTPAGFMSDDLLLDECMTLFLAGHETTANALTWTWYLLAQHPNISADLQCELQRVLQGRPPTLEDLPALQLTSHIFHEALRLYPPAWIIAREAVTDYRLGDIHAPAGSTLLLSPYATQRDPRFWNSPETFDPSRWSGSATAARSSFSFFSFGAGTRVCIGEHFAMMEGVLLIAALAQQWNFDLVPGQDIQPWPRITLRPREAMQFSLTRHSQPAPEPVASPLETVSSAH
jgi:cytochrome P450